jgi:hypothetical protein
MRDRWVEEVRAVGTWEQADLGLVEVGERIKRRKQRG